MAAAVQRREVPYDVTILPAFDSRWLPTQSPISRIEADGDWRYDTSTMDFLAVPDDLSTCVDIANGLDGAADFVHMPVDRDTAFIITLVSMAFSSVMLSV